MIVSIPDRIRTNGLARWLVIIVLAVVVGFLMGRVGSGDDEMATAHDHVIVDTATATEWTCSMHPQIKLPTEGQCPICFMDLIPLLEDDGAGLGPTDLVLTESAAALADIVTSSVVRRFVARQVRLVGALTHDETRLVSISARVPGRLDELYVDFTGQSVRQGQKLAAIYSPELYSAQAELRAAATAYRTAAGSGSELALESAHRNRQSARERLRLWGLTADQIETIEQQDELTDHLTLYSPVTGVVVKKSAVEGQYVGAGSPLYTVSDLSRLWVQLAAYENDLPWLRLGQSVTFTVRALPGQKFSGEISFIDPVLDPRTRTVPVRLEISNETGQLKPGMYVQAVVAATLDADGVVVTEPLADLDPAVATPPLVIPASAPLRTGNRAVVYVRDPNAAEPTFSGREIVLGPRAGDWFVVAEGLHEGELVVTRGNFKLDSALQIQARPSMMNPPAAEMDSGDPVIPLLDGPACFVDRLGEILAAYLPLQAALAGDDDSTAVVTGRSVLIAIENVSCARDHLPPDAQEPWLGYYNRLFAAAKELVAAPNLTKRRLPFQPLSDTLWEALVAFGVETGEHVGGSVGQFHCPMAMDGAGANWIQTGETVANPYYGASMLRCGWRNRLLNEPPVANGSEGS